MKTNVGGIDRILLGGPVWAWIGVVPLATGLMGFCALYPLLGINTCPMKK